MRAIIAVALSVATCLPPLSPAASVAASDPGEAVFGEWGTQGMNAKVTVSHCPGQTDRVCGAISWLWEPLDPEGRAKTDAENPDRHLRGRALMGTQILRDFRRKSTGRLDEGTIYNPEDGRTYDATLRLQDADTLIVEGCVLFICRKQIWRRTSSVCGTPR